MAFLIAAISLGFLGSFHCIGMCGPIAMALPVHTLPISKRIIAILAYNSGRIVTYSLLGILFGAIGQTFSFFGFQQKLSVALGILILLGLFISVASTKNIYLLNKLNFNKLKTKIAGQFEKKGIRSFLSIGILNGLLPCGLVYLGIAGALATGNIIKGSLFMAVFGLGTLPFMFTISYTSHLISLKTRNAIKKAMPVMIGLTAILLVLRGANLGIKYISPSFIEDKQERSQCHSQIKCCHKK